MRHDLLAIMRVTSLVVPGTLGVVVVAAVALVPTPGGLAAHTAGFYTVLN